MKIAIAGYGIEGKSNYKYYSNRGYDVTIVDQRSEIDGLPENVKTILGTDAFTQLLDFDLVVRTAGLAPKKIQTNGKVWSSTNEFFDKCPAKIIGVTGTKGKGTTASLIVSILQAAGKKVHLVGNIGTAALDILDLITPDDIVVYEFSSFQLWDIEKSPQTAIVLMVEPDHLNVHDDFHDYVNAKSNIRRFQTDEDVCLYHPTNQYSKKIAISNPNSQTAKRFGIEEDGLAYVKSNTFFVQDTPICSTDVLQIRGNHNIENACAAISAIWNITTDKQVIEKGLHSFTGLPHRLKFVANVRGVEYYDDSYSSAPGAATAAINAFTQPEVVILGGYDKGGDFSELAKSIKASETIRKVVLIGQNRHKIAETFKKHGIAEADFMILDTIDFREIVSIAASQAKSGDVVILSPASASFDMFKNFTERGEHYINHVHSL